IGDQQNWYLQARTGVTRTDLSAEHFEGRRRGMLATDSYEAGGGDVKNLDTTKGISVRGYNEVEGTPSHYGFSMNAPGGGSGTKLAQSAAGDRSTGGFGSGGAVQGINGAFGSMGFGGRSAGPAT